MARIFLIGPMGSGKTSVGRALARKIGHRFIDSDREIEARCGVDIPTIFDYEGEAGFRDREARMINELTRLDDVVLATGGGSVLREANRDCLRVRGHVILLSVDLEEQLKRVSFDGNRPLLHTEDPAGRLRALMTERAPIYRAVADVEISTDSRRMYHVVSRILKHLRQKALIPEADSAGVPLVKTRTPEKSKPTQAAHSSGEPPTVKD